MKVLILTGSKNDLEVVQPIREHLAEFGIDAEVHISSAHQNLERTAGLVKNAEANGFQVIIACAGMAAHLPGVVASLTVLPVIGVPLKGGALNGKDALYSIVQMPPGVPVATVAMNGIKNAAILAAQIIGISNQEVREKLLAFKKKMAEG